MALIYDKRTSAPLVVGLASRYAVLYDGRQGLVNPHPLQCLVETLSLITELVVESSVCCLKGHLESSPDSISSQLCVLGQVTFPLLASCSSSVQLGGELE